ncbi:MAG: hypothetical protein HGA47_07195 [Zoogloea sp.]|nr:hypothetical protein [Zoogloea sp.]
MTRFFAAIAAASCLSACGGNAGLAPPHDWLFAPAAGMLAISNGYLSLPVLAGGVAVYAVEDPFAPNWEIREARLGDDRVRIQMRLRAVHTGGEGEARQVFQRRAEELARLYGGRFEIMAFNQGIESSRPFARNVAEGEIRLFKEPPGAALSGTP